MTDAKEIKTEFSYDAYKRVLHMRKLSVSHVNGPLVEDRCQRVNYVLTTCSDEGVGGVGRLTSVFYGWTVDAQQQVVACLVPGNVSQVMAFKEIYTYNAAGRTLSKTLQYWRNHGTLLRSAGLKLDWPYNADWTFKVGGQATSVTYPFQSWVPAENGSAPSAPGTAPASLNIYNVFAQICIGKQCVTSQINTGSILGRNDEVGELRMAEKCYELEQQHPSDWGLDEKSFKAKYGKCQDEISAKHGDGFATFGACRNEDQMYVLNNSGRLPQFALCNNALRLADTILSVLNRTTIGVNGERSEFVRELQIIVRRLLFDDAPDINGLRSQASTFATGLFNTAMSDCAKAL